MDEEAAAVTSSGARGIAPSPGAGNRLAPVEEFLNVKSVSILRPLPGGHAERAIGCERAAGRAGVGEHYSPGSGRRDQADDAEACGTHPQIVADSADSL